MDKALWLTSFSAADLDRVLDHAAEADARLLCIRTTSSALKAAISKFKNHNIDVYGWRWPAVIKGTYRAPHYYALDEAEYVAQHLMGEGLAGYIIDPESDGPGRVDDWNDAAHAPLARQFCERLLSHAPTGFHFGITSGCEYPKNHSKIPWHEFVAHATALYPQTYWRSSQHGSVHGGTPASSYQRGIAAWSTISGGKPLVAIGGELAIATAAEIHDFGALVSKSQGVAHFYADGGHVAPAALKAIGST